MSLKIGIKRPLVSARRLSEPTLVRGQRGFTLLELLLATVLVLLLLGAAVFSFSALQRGAELEEGAAQFEALLRYARAQAAGSGRQVQVSFEEDFEQGICLPLGKIRVTWEADPLGQPGFFEELAGVRYYMERINELVEVESVRVFDASGAESASRSSTNDPGPVASEAGVLDFLDFLPPITFYPDGSSDSAEIVLVGRAEDSPGRMAVRLAGLTGAIRRQLVVEEEPEPAAEMQPPPPEPPAPPVEQPLVEAPPVVSPQPTKADRSFILPGTK